MSSLADLLARPHIKLEEVSEHLDSLDRAARLFEVVSIGKSAQMKLWEIAEGAPPLSFEFLVPRDAKPLEPYPFEGKNSLPFFTRFQKVFYLDRDRNVCGYNNQSMMWFSGPGYYMTQVNPDDEGEIQIDYTRLPSERPEGGPQIKSNDRFPSKHIYGGTRDNLRRVSKDAAIGRAFKENGEAMPNWFVLCRARAAG